MHKLYATSALFALAVGATVWAQPPAKTDPPGKKADVPGKKADVPKKPADPTDAALATALAHDAGVKMARAKLQLAEAELAQAKQTVALRVFTLKAQLESLKAERDVALKHVEIVEAQVVAARANQIALAEVRVAYEKVNRALAVAEAEWKILTGGDAVAAQDARALEAVYGLKVQRAYDAAAMAWLLQKEYAAKPPVGPVPERIRAALDKPVKLGKKGDAVQVTEALEVIKRDAGLDVAIRGLDSFRAAFEIDGAELPAGAWFQLIQDQFGLVAYVREYGILFAKKESAPADAISLVEFWKQKPAAEPKK